MESDPGDALVEIIDKYTNRDEDMLRTLEEIRSLPETPNRD